MQVSPVSGGFWTSAFVQQCVPGETCAAISNRSIRTPGTTSTLQNSIVLAASLMVKWTIGMKKASS